ncbi:MAG: hypothetical protein ACK5OB_21425 [Pirellula sp.]
MRIHPRRLFCNVVGDFYATGENPKPGKSRSRWMGDCLTCHGPESQAQELLAELNSENTTTYFVRQPETEIETERACRAVQYCCVDALRYAGQNPAIIHRLGNNPAHCDYVIAKDGRMVYCLDENGELLPWAAEIRNAIGMGIDVPSVPEV